LPTFTFGGAERTSLNLLRGMDKDRFRICLVTSKTMSGYFQNIDIEKIIAIENLGLDVWFNSAKRFVHDVRKIAIVLKEEKPDISFGMMHYPSSLLVFAKKFFQVKTNIIVSPRGPSTEYLKHFEDKLLRKALLRWIFGSFCRYADGVVVASSGMKNECVREYRAKPERVEVIPNSIDVNDIKTKIEEEADIDIPAGFKLIVTLGRLEKEKNITVLLKVFSEVRKKEKIKLLIIGDGSEKTAIERLVLELNIREDVILVGHQNNPYKYIMRADIFVHTCLFEGFANVIIEAMACGVPVVAVDCPYGPRDIIKDEENGILVQMNDEGALADAIMTLLHNRQLRDLIAKRGFERAMDFTANKMVESYERFFQRILDKRIN